MLAQTHKQYAVQFALVANMILYTYGITEINYYISLPIVLLTAKWGALFPDIDHDWHSVKEKTVINWFINKAIHLTGGKHRSWQTHSMDICAIFTVVAIMTPRILNKYYELSTVNMEVMSIILLGFCTGWISHIISDMLTPAGVRVLCFMPYKAKFVPHKIGKIKFSTGSAWESFCYSVTKKINILLGIIALLYPLILNGKIQELFSMLN